MNGASLEKALSSPSTGPNLTIKAIWLITSMELICVRLDPFSIVVDKLMHGSINVDKISKMPLNI